MIDDDAVKIDQMDALLFRVRRIIERGMQDCDTSEEIMRRVKSQIDDVIRPSIGRPIPPICHDPDADLYAGEPPVWVVASLFLLAIVIVLRLPYLFS